MVLSSGNSFTQRLIYLMSILQSARLFTFTAFSTRGKRLGKIESVKSIRFLNLFMRCQPHLPAKLLKNKSAKRLIVKLVALNTVNNVITNLVNVAKIENLAKITPRKNVVLRLEKHVFLCPKKSAEWCPDSIALIGHEMFAKRSKIRSAKLFLANLVKRI